MMKSGSYSVKQILKTEVHDRTENEKFFLRQHLKLNVPFFGNYEGSILNNICNQLHQRMYNKGEVIVRKGDVGNEMFVILVGEVGVYFDDDLKHCIVELNENKTFGDRSLQNEEVRSAHIVAHKVTVCLVLSKTDFYEQVFHIEHLQKMKRLSYLRTLPIF